MYAFSTRRERGKRKKSQIDTINFHLKNLGKKTANYTQLKQKEENDKEQKRNVKAHSFTREFYQMLNKELTPILHILFQKTEEKGRLLDLFYEASIILKPKPDKDGTINGAGRIGHPKAKINK